MDTVRNRFRNPRRQRAYATYVRRGIDLTGGLRTAFALGLEGHPNRYLKDSAAYIAYVAGCDSRDRYHVIRPHLSAVIVEGAKV